VGPIVSRLGGQEWIAEYEWLRANGSSVFMACDALGKSLESAERFMFRHNRHDLAQDIRRAYYDIKSYQRAG